MHPAKSVIFFTTATGAGYGLLFWASALILSGSLSYSWNAWLSINAVALFLITAGLLSSTLHLGHPERAWRALSQWRSSWLSREGVAALAAYLPILLLALAWYNHANVLVIGTLAVVVMIMTMITVYCTAMIYGSLKPVPSWHNPAAVLGYPLYSLATGAVLLWCLSAEGSFSFSPYIPVACLIFSCVCKAWHWRLTGKAIGITLESATGLAQPGSSTKVRSFELPHSSANYLMKEMGFEVARKHAIALKVFVLLAAFVIPVVVVLLAPVPNLITAPLVLLICMLGIAAERWLFFAEAFHIVALFYGKKP